MQEEQRSPLVTIVLILNSVLLGVMVFALLCALGEVSLAVDQEVGLRPVADVTQWVFDHTPHDFLSAISLSVGATATCLFFSLAFPSGVEKGQRTTFHLLFITSFCLIVAICLFFAITGIATSLVRVYGDLWVQGSPRPVHTHSSMHLQSVSLGSSKWVYAVAIYSIGLFIFGFRLRRKTGEINNSPG